MTRFHVPDMSCGHCKATIEKALAGIDADAKVEVDLDTRSVRVASARPASELQAAMKASGYESSVAD